MDKNEKIIMILKEDINKRKKNIKNQENHMKMKEMYPREWIKRY